MDVKAPNSRWENFVNILGVKNKLSKIISNQRNIIVFVDDDDSWWFMMTVMMVVMFRDDRDGPDRHPL